MTKREAAANALAAHDALRAAHDSEPPSDSEGMPLNASKWLEWRREVSEPAYADWKSAMDDLDAAMGESVRRHPFSFRPLCEKIIAA